MPAVKPPGNTELFFGFYIVHQLIVASEKNSSITIDHLANLQTLLEHVESLEEQAREGVCFQLAQTFFPSVPAVPKPEFTTRHCFLTVPCIKACEGVDPFLDTKAKLMTATGNRKDHWQ